MCCFTVILHLLLLKKKINESVQSFGKVASYVIWHGRLFICKNFVCLFPDMLELEAKSRNVFLKGNALIIIKKHNPVSAQTFSVVNVFQ